MIEARNLVKRYGSTMAVNDLSFSIRPGLVTGFLGPNGAGKTTTMPMILGRVAVGRLAERPGQPRPYRVSACQKYTTPATSVTTAQPTPASHSSPVVMAGAQ